MSLIWLRKICSPTTISRTTHCWKWLCNEVSTYNIYIVVLTPPKRQLSCSPTPNSVESWTIKPLCGFLRLTQIPLTVLHAWWEISRRIRVICVALNPYISLFSSFFTKKIIGIDSIIHVCNQTILLRCKTSTASSYSKKNTINALIDDAKIHENFRNLKSFRSFYHCFSLFNHHSHDAHVSLPNFDFHKKPMCNTSARHMPLI